MAVIIHSLILVVVIMIPKEDNNDESLLDIETTYVTINYRNDQQEEPQVDQKEQEVEEETQEVKEEIEKEISLPNTEDSIPTSSEVTNEGIEGSEGLEESIASIFKEPIILEEEELYYPLRARRSRLSGNVFFVILINEEGDVIEFDVTECSHTMFVESAEDYISSLKFSPATKDGKAVPYEGTFEVNFEII